MMDDPSYRSFLMRLWRASAAEGGVWHAEVEHIRSGAVVAVSSLEEAFSLIRRTAAGDEERRGDSGSQPHLRLVSDRPR
jgi:hypothetical protein